MTNTHTHTHFQFQFFFLSYNLLYHFPILNMRWTNWFFFSTDRIHLFHRSSSKFDLKVILMFVSKKKKKILPLCRCCHQKKTKMTTNDLVNKTKIMDQNWMMFFLWLNWIMTHNGCWQQEIEQRTNRKKINVFQINISFQLQYWAALFFFHHQFFWPNKKKIFFFWKSLK